MPKPQPPHDSHVAAWRQDLARQWQYLPRSVFNKNRLRFVGLGVDRALDAGFMALSRAAKSFNPDFGFKFSTYASRAIFVEMTHHLQRLLLRQPFERKHMSLAALCGPESLGEFDVLEAQAVDVSLGMMAEDVMRAVERLPKNLRQAFLLTVRDDLTYREVGERMGVSKERVRQLRNQAIAKLRNKLGVGLAS